MSKDIKTNQRCYFSETKKAVSATAFFVDANIIFATRILSVNENPRGFNLMVGFQFQNIHTAFHTAI